MNTPKPVRTIAFCAQYKTTIVEKLIADCTRLLNENEEFAIVSTHSFCMTPLMLHHFLSATSYSCIVVFDQHTLMQTLEIRTQEALATPLFFYLPSGSLLPFQTLPTRCGGITSNGSQWPHECSILPRNLPRMDNILIVHDYHYEEDAVRLQSALTRARIYTVALRYQNTLTRQLIMLMKHYEMIIVLAQSLPAEYTERIISICATRKTILYTNNYGLLFSGAQFYFGPDSKAIAQSLCNSITQALSQSEEFSCKEIPDTFIINSGSCPSITIDNQPLLKLLDSIQIITPSTHEKVAAYLRLEELPLE